ncbi:hypothetical protein [Liquorilactobacillus hordei]|uniref:hypothetical protein n=1 Tax=Liquorilactobacillus hordei TaxID=468911 RepID=UPI0039E7B79A
MKKIVDLSKIEELLNSNVSAYAISKDTNLTRAVINRYRTGKTKLENMTIKVALKLQEFYDEHYIKPTISYDSDEMIAELKEDIASFGDFECWAWIKKIDGVKIYTNYDFKESVSPLSTYEINQAKENGEQFEILKAKHLLELLEKQNEIL